MGPQAIILYHCVNIGTKATMYPLSLCKYGEEEVKEVEEEEEEQEEKEEGRKR